MRMHLGIDNSRRSVIPVIGACSETLHGRIICQIIGHIFLHLLILITF